MRKHIYKPLSCIVLLKSLVIFMYINELRHEISNNVVCATSKASDQSSLIKGFACCLNILWVEYSMSRTSFGVSKLKRRLHRLVWVYTCQNTTLLEITYRGSYSQNQLDKKFILETEPDVVETPIFKTMEPSEPVHQSKRLRWDHKVSKHILTHFLQLTTNIICFLICWCSLVA